MKRVILKCLVCNISLEFKDLQMIFILSGPRCGSVQGVCPACSGSNFEIKQVGPEEKEVIGGKWRF